MTDFSVMNGERVAARSATLARVVLAVMAGAGWGFAVAQTTEPIAAPTAAPTAAAPTAAPTAVPTVAPESAGTLAPVVVTAGRFADDADKLSFGVSVLTAKDLRRSGVRTINEAVMKLLGVPGRVDFYGGGDYGLDLRGFGQTAGSNQVVILDGIKINEGDLSNTRLAGIDIDSVERIEVIRGNSAVLYGEGATGGAIVITTRAGSGAVRRNQMQVYSALGNFNTLDGRASATVVAGEFSLDAAVNMRSTDNHRENFHTETQGASTSVQWAHDGLRVGVRHAHDRLEGGLPGDLSAAQYAQNPYQASTPTDSATIHNANYGLFSSLDLGNWQLGLDAGWRDKSLSSYSPLYTYAYEVDARTLALKARHSARWGSWANALMFGLDRSEWEREVLGAYGSLAAQRSNALYAKDDVTLFSGTRLSVGARAEAIEKSNTSAPAAGIDDTQHAWELGLLQPLMDQRLSVYGRVGSSFRLANADEFSFTSPGATLRPQRSRDAELGARWHQAGTRAELRVYRSHLTDEIGYDGQAPGPWGLGANVNYADPTRRQGLELEAAQALGAGVNLRVVAAQRSARFESGPYASRQIPLVPRHALSLVAEWQPTERHRLDTVLRGVSSAYVDMANTCAVPGYATLDLRYAYLQPGLELAVGVGNATDHQYYTQAYSCAGGQTSGIYPEAGRSVTASVRVAF